MISTHIDYFPSKLAKDPRFCNRIAERQSLKRNIEMGRHTVVISPRRYGKTSLIHKVVGDANLPFAAIDLFLANDNNAITKRILEGISEAITNILPVTQKALAIAQTYFNNFKLVLHASGFSLQASHAYDTIDPVEQIFDSLKSLAELARKKNKTILLFIDEFQDIANAESAKAIQGAIRNVAQDTSNLIFVFFRQ